jgi:hypothetical protein
VLGIQKQAAENFAVAIMEVLAQKGPGERGTAHHGRLAQWLFGASSRQLARGEDQAQFARAQARLAEQGLPVTLKHARQTTETAQQRIGQLLCRGSRRAAAQQDRKHLGITERADAALQQPRLRVLGILGPPR